MSGAPLDLIARMAQELESAQRELRVQFARIAQLQSDLDILRAELKGVRSAPQLIDDRARGSARRIPWLSRREWLEPTMSVELTYSEVMQGRLRDPVYRRLG